MFSDFIKGGTYLRALFPRAVRTYWQSWSSLQQSLHEADSNSLETLPDQVPDSRTSAQRS